MGKAKSNKQIITIFYFFISMISCSNMYENNIYDILCIQDISVISSKRYESHAIGEWYILERYVLFGDTAIQLDVTKDIEVCDIKRHPF